MEDRLLTYGSILVLFTLVVYFIKIYNRIINYKQSVESAKSSIGVEMKKRTDLIPEIINSVKGFVKHETYLMKELTKLRADLSGEFLKTFLAVAEEYPVLRSSESFLELQTTLSEVEYNIAASRHIYNSNVDYYNSLIGSFPAMLFGFTQMHYLEFDEADAKVVSVPTNFEKVN